ncbi:unnamed protein product, partial [Brassica oleracea var. botrytis]
KNLWSERKTLSNTEARLCHIWKLFRRWISCPSSSAASNVHKSLTNASFSLGALVTDELVVGIIDEAMNKPKCQKGFILNWFRRTV